MTPFRLSDGTLITDASFDNVVSRIKRAIVRTVHEARTNPKGYAKAAAPGAAAGAALTAIVMAVLST